MEKESQNKKLGNLKLIFIQKHRIYLKLQKVFFMGN